VVVLAELVLQKREVVTRAVQGFLGFSARDRGPEGVHAVRFLDDVLVVLDPSLVRVDVRDVLPVLAERTVEAIALVAVAVDEHHHLAALGALLAALRYHSLSLATAWSGKKRAKRGWVDAGVVATVAPAVITTATLGTGEHMSGSRDESVEDEDEAFDEDESLGEGQTAFDDRLDEAVAFSESVIRGIEVVAAYVLVGLFAIGVFDLGLQIAEQALSGRIFQPEVVVGFIDTALLLFIIV